MIRSRPGFQTQVIDDSKEVASAAGARLNRDMIPAIARHSTAKPAASKSPLTQSAPANAPPPFADPSAMQQAAERAFAKMQESRRLEGPEVLINPTPSATPVMTSPHKE